jgi:uncharacterized membrane protein HdeD (DUF308 family)
MDHGQVAYLHGDHGSGKTHSVLYLLNHVAGDHSKIGTMTYRFYVKAQDGNFLDIYRRIMEQLSMTALRNLSLRFLGILAAEQAGRTFGEEAAASVLERLRESPDRIFALYDRMVVDPGAVLEAQASELAGVVGRREDFQRALTFLLDPALETAAYEWLVGHNITIRDASRLGVSGPIDDPQLCRYGVQLLVAMCARIREPIILVIDQCERLIFDENHDLYMPNVGLLHSLVEAVPRENGMLVLVGSEDAWRAVPRDFRQRFGLNDLLSTILTPDQAIELLGVYIGAVTGETAADDPYPFSTGAVHALLAASGGNIRRLLQLSWEVFDQAVRNLGQAVSDNLITADDVEATGQGWGGMRRNEAEHAIERLLRQEGLTFERPWRRGAVKADYAVLSGTEPRLLIWIMEAVFYDDEARGALSILSWLQQVLEEGWPTRVVLVVLGYCSPAVLSRLELAADDVIVYDGVEATQQLRTIAEQLSSQTEQASIADRGRLDEIYQALQLVAESRDQEVRALRSELNSLLSRISETSVPAGGRGNWVQRRQQLLDRIADVRELRRRDQLSDVETAHADAERDRRNRYFVAAAVIGIPLLLIGILIGSWPTQSWASVGAALGSTAVAVGLVLAFLPFTPRTLWSPSSILLPLGACVAAAGVGFFILYLGFTYPFYYSYRPTVQALLVALGLIIGTGCVLAGISVLRTRPARELSRPVDSFERLAQVTRSYAEATSLGPYQLEAALKYADPHLRYAGIITVKSSELLHRTRHDDGSDGYDRESDPPLLSGRREGYERALARQFRVEPTVILRREAARALGTAPPSLVEAVIEDGIRENIAEIVYLVEIAKVPPVSLPTDDDQSTSAATALAGWRQSVEAADSADNLLWYILKRVTNVDSENEFWAALKDWYGGEQDPSSWSRLRRIPERSFRQAATILSPFEKGGLGTFDELSMISEIDNMYLFVEQLIFYRELSYSEERGSS